MQTSSTIATFFRARARAWPERRCLVDARTLTYGQVLERVQRWSTLMARAGVRSGDRVALLSRNRSEYLELLLACAWRGAILAAQNWRLAEEELAYCLDLVEPTLTIASPALAERVQGRPEPLWLLDDALEERLQQAAVDPEPAQVDPEETLVLLYTSGTTGRPKAAMISHRAEIVRNLVLRAEFGVAETDSYVCWTPLYHMGGLEYSLGTLLGGGCVFVLDGFDAERLVELVRHEPIGWLMLMPGMVTRFADSLEKHAVTPRGVKLCGVMADLVPRAEIARVTRLLQAPYANTFGSTETGCPPCSSDLIPIGEAPEALPKRVSPYCEVRLVDAAGDDVPEGDPGELWMRGPTLFSGYWRNPEATAQAFAEGWYHMGDVFRRLDDGTLAFVDRRKYLIKSGGENIYPAELERVLLAHPGVEEAAVVARPDPRWGEVPVAFVASRDPSLDEEGVVALCTAKLASYKKPKQVYFIDRDAFPRSASGKVLRHELAARLQEAP